MSSCSPTLAGLRVGFLTCYDIRFPEQAKALAVAGAQLLVVPSAWAAGLYKEEHWVTLVRARAIENTIWVAAAGQVPDPAEPPTRAPTGVGRSLLVNPMGVVKLDLGPAASIGTGDVDTEYTESVRSALPSLAHRREDLFPGAAIRTSSPAGFRGRRRWASTAATASSSAVDATPAPCSPVAPRWWRRVARPAPRPGAAG